jgi:hypothetical protein
MSSAVVLVAMPALVALVVGGLFGWKLGHAAGLLHGAEQMVTSNRQVFGRLAAHIAWQERKLDELGYDPATDPDNFDPTDLPAEIEEYLRGAGS